MKSYLISLSTSLALLFTISSCSYDRESPNAKHVVIIGIDGLSPDGIRSSETPVFDRMMRNGSYTLHARAVMPTSSGANWGSMLTGAGPEQHGIISNDWRTDNVELPAASIQNEYLYPTIFAAIRKQKPNAKLAAIFDWNPIINYVEKEVIDYQALPANEDETTAASIDIIKKNRPLFTFIHIDHVDGAGHRYGHGSPEYYRSVEKADSLVGEIIKATEDAGIFDDTVFILSSDHGGVGYGHGGNSLLELEIPFIVYGKQVKENHELLIPINTFDTPATALFALGLSIPFEWIGRPVKSSFQGNRDPELMFTLNNLIPAPKITPLGEGGSNPAGGLFINENPTMEITNPNEEGTIRFTTNGSLPAFYSKKYEESIEITKNTVIHARVFDDERPISDLSSAYFRIINSTDGHGLKYQIFENDNMAVLPDFNLLDPVNSGTVLEVSSNHLDLTRQHHVAVKMQGFIKIPTMGRYRFYLASDDGSKLYINNNLVVDNDGDHGVLTKSGEIILTEGRHFLQVDWFNGGGGYWLGAMIEGPEMPRQIIPPSMLYLNQE